MDVGQFGDGMTQRIINLSERAVAAMDVGDGDLTDVRGGRSGEGFDAIADDQNDIGLELYKGVGEFGNRLAGGDGYCVWRRGGRPGHYGGGCEAGILDGSQWVAMSRIQVHSCSD